MDPKSRQRILRLYFAVSGTFCVALAAFFVISAEPHMRIVAAALAMFFGLMGVIFLWRAAVGWVHARP